MNAFLEQKSAAHELMRNCRDSLDTGIKAAQENAGHTAHLIRDFLAAESARRTELSQKAAACNAAFEKLAESAGRLSDRTAELDAKLGVSCRALGIVENAEQVFDDMPVNFTRAFDAHALETQKTLLRITDRLLSVSRQCEFFKTSPKPWTEMIRLYSAKIESVFGKIAIQQEKTREAQEKIRGVYFLVDCSGSMRGEKMKAVNTALPLLLPDLEKHGISHIGILAFSKWSSWMNCSLFTELGVFGYQNLQAEGITNLGAAFFELFKALSGYPRNSPPPRIIVISDGEPTDDWELPLTALNGLPCFRAAEKHAFTLEYTGEIEALTAFTGESAKIIPVKQAAFLLPALQKTLSGESTTGSINADDTVSVEIIEADEDDSMEIIEDAVEKKDKDYNKFFLCINDGNKYNKSFLSKNNNKIGVSGPFTWQEVLDKAYKREITKRSYIQRYGCEWTEIDFYPELKKIVDEGVRL